MSLWSNLYKKILLRPAIARGADKLLIVSGYATSAMADRHLKDLAAESQDVGIDLVVGMTPYGIAESNHKGFVSLTTKKMSKHSFKCSYVYSGPAVHAKAYAWFQGEKLVEGFVGSANYTQKAFSKGQVEAAVPCNPSEILGLYRAVLARSRICTHTGVAGLILPEDAANSRDKDYDKFDAGTLQSLGISFLDRKGMLPRRSGLNWGQRPEAHREKNQAYIPLPLGAGMKKIVNDFFPPRGVHFTIYTDDKEQFFAARQQDAGKAIHSTENNSILGKYFRRRLGVPLGALITKLHLIEYGRTGVTFYKRDDENYIMDFSPYGNLL